MQSNHIHCHQPDIAHLRRGLKALWQEITKNLQSGCCREDGVDGFRIKQGNGGGG